MSRTQTVDGEHVLYHYLQKNLSETDVWLFQMLTARLVVALGIWLPPEVYSSMPILLPFARRDSSARGNKRTGSPESWGSPDAQGYFRDDNSLVKGLVRSLEISSPLENIYDKRRLGKSFVSSHVWREIVGADGLPTLASLQPSTYSFVPNLVWLPAQVSKLTDREGSFVQQFLQALSHRIYSTVPVREELSSLVEGIWARLPIPPIPAAGLPDTAELSFFHCEDSFVETRQNAVREVADAIRHRLAGSEIPRAISSRFGTGFRNVGDAELLQLLETISLHSGLPRVEAPSL